MTFVEFQKINRDRCETKWHPLETDHFDLKFWVVAISGETGEMANLVKKVCRGDFPLEDARQEILKEVADIMTYCDLLMSYLGADTGEEILKKFDEVSKRVGYERLQ